MKLPSFAKNLIFNLSSNYLKNLVVAILGFVITPIIIKEIGEAQFGLYRLILDLFANIGIFEFGLSGALLATYHALGKDYSHQDLIDKGVKSYLGTLPAILAFLVSAYFFLPYFFKIQAEYQSAFRYCYSICSMAFIFIIFNPVPMYLQSNQLNGIVNVFTTIQMLVVQVLNFILVKIGMGLIGLGLAVLAGNIIYYLVLYFAIRFKKTDLPPVQESDYKKLIQDNRTSNFSLNMTNRLNFFFDNTIIMYLFDSKMLAAFFLNQRLANMITNQFQSTGVSIWSNFTSSLGVDRDKFNEDIESSSHIIYSLSCCLLFPLYILNKSFVSLWVGEKLFLAGSLGLFIAILYPLTCITFYWCQLLVGIGRSMHIQNAYVVFALMNIILSVLLTRELGVIGPLCGSLIAQVATIIFLVRYFYKEFEISLIRIFLFPVILFSMHLLIGHLLDIKTQSWFVLCVYFLLFVTVNFLLCFYLSFSRLERSKVMNSLKVRFKK